MNDKILIPVSILIAALLVGSAVYFTTTNKDGSKEQKKISSETKIEIPLVDSEKDHILGNKNAEIYIVEYSDLECPYCKRYNDGDSKKLKDKFLDGEKVGFVFRHFPLTSIHPSSFEEATALECSAILEGNDKFFEYKEKVFSETKSNGRFNSNKLVEIAEELNLNKSDFEDCLKSEKAKKIVRESYQDGIDAGLRGTPAVFLQLKGGERYSVPADFEVINRSVTSYLSELK